MENSCRSFINRVTWSVVVANHTATSTTVKRSTFSHVASVQRFKLTTLSCLPHGKLFCHIVSLLFRHSAVHEIRWCFLLGVCVWLSGYSPMHHSLTRLNDMTNEIWMKCSRPLCQTSIHNLKVLRLELESKLWLWVTITLRLQLPFAIAN